MRHHHRWPYILIPLIFCLPTLLATAHPSAKNRHYQKQIHRLVGGHLRIIDPESDDSELITASAGDNTKSKKGQKGGDDERKTLSQQVADGKYGLIQKELFRIPPKRPGIISYSANSEVPNDNIQTLGGLTKSDIWLAENHLLVIKGGTYPAHDDTKQEFVDQLWQPIDDYNAPLHQVKIPKNPKIPPPFPVQLSDDGPLQILGTNSSRTLNETAETPAYALPPPPGWDGEIPPQSQYFPPQAGSANTDSPYITPGQAPMRGSVSGEPPGGLPFPPAPLNGSLPPYFAHLPLGAVVLPAPIGNETDPGILDEEDPSIYYPPPYSFYYPKDNSSVVPPGPLVPGIILPPPPKFFAPLEEEPRTTTSTTTKRTPYTRPTYTTKQTTQEPPLSNEITTSKTHKYIPTKVSVVKQVTVRVGPSRKTTPRIQQHTTKLIKTTVPTTGKPKIITILPVHVGRLNRTYLPPKNVPSTKKKLPVTVLRPVKPEQATPKVYLYRNEVSDKPEISYNENPRQKPKTNPEYVSNDQRQTYNSQQRPAYNENRQKFRNNFISSTPVPLKYHSSTKGTTGVLPEKFSIGIHAQYPKTTSKPPANYYFYEEIDPNNNLITTERPILKPNPQYYEPPSQYYEPNPPTPAPPVILKSNLQPPVRPQYVYVNGRPYESEKPRFRYVPQNEPRQKQPNNFSFHVAKLQSQIHQYYTTQRAPIKHTPKPVYQYSFEAQHYRPVASKNFRPSPPLDGSSDSFKPMPKYSVQIQPAIEIVPTQQPNYQQIQQLNVEEPTYYSTERPQVYNQQQYVRQQYTTERPKKVYNQQYHHEVQKLQGYIHPNHDPQVEITPAKTVAEFSYDATPNPLHQGFYTEPDEGYFDERTRQSFTVFGRKLPSATTPVPAISRPPKNNFRRPEPPPRYRNNVYNRPISLQSDINVNYVKPRPPVNPDSEPIRPESQYYPENQSERNPEIIKAIEITPSSLNSEDNERFIQYQLPGDEGAHFYFLTPQQIERRRQAAYPYKEEERTKRDSDKNNEKEE